jgi:hypothetical protein
VSSVAYISCGWGVAHERCSTAATYQTLLNSERLAKFDPHKVTAVIIDEAHHAAAPSYVYLDPFTLRKGDWTRLFAGTGSYFRISTRRFAIQIPSTRYQSTLSLYPLSVSLRRSVGMTGWRWGLCSSELCTIVTCYR